MSDRDIVFVFGSGRCGSSALTRTLSLCGCALPKLVLAPREMNPTGFWESAKATKINLEFLILHGTGVAHPAMYISESIDERDREALIESIRVFLTDCPHAKTLAIKCSGTLLLLDFWKEAARREGFASKVVIALRHPEEVAASWAASGMVSPGLASAFWLKQYLMAEHNSRDLPRVVVEYPNLLKDWRAEISRVSNSLSIELNAEESAIDSFLTPSLHRQRCSGPILEPFAYSWLSRVYAILSQAAQDHPVEMLVLDEIYEAYEANERVFRIASDEFRRRSTSLDVFRETFEQWPTWELGRDF